MLPFRALTHPEPHHCSIATPCFVPSIIKRYCTMQGVLEKKTAGSKWVNVQCVLEGRNLASGEAPMAVLEVTDIENRVREPGHRALHVFMCC